MTYEDPDGVAHVGSGAYALRFAVLVRDGGTGPWGFWATSRSRAGAERRLREAHRRGGFGPGNSAIVEGSECAHCAPDEPCATHIGTVEI